MKRLLPLILLFTGMVNSQIVSIPDNNFKAKLIAADVNNAIALDSNNNPIKIDTNNDGQIQETEAQTVYVLNLWDGFITDLTGILSFTNLNRLDCHNNLLTTLNVNSMSSLRQLMCQQNHITSLNVSGITNLNLLMCGDNQIGNLTVTGLSSLVLLSCEKNNLSSINMNGLTNLAQLTCSYNQIASLNLNNFPHLNVLQCDHNMLTSLDVTNLNSLTQLYCFYNQISSLDLSNCVNLTGLSCGENTITTLNLNGLSNLSSLECSYMPDNFVINGNGLSSLTSFQFTGQTPNITLNGFPNVTYVNLTFPPPVSTVTVNLSGFNSNASLYVYKELTGPLTVNGSGTTALQLFNAQNTRLNSLTINNISNLNALDCHMNALASLSLNNLGMLTSLNCGQNRITNLDLNNVPNLVFLNCGNNNLSSLNVSGLTHLKYFDFANDANIDINGNHLTTIDLTGLNDLEYFDCSNYRMAGLLGAHGNEINSLNINGLTHLKQVKCSVNKLPTLTVNGLTNLEVLDCSNNLLTNLDLVGLTSMTTLSYAKNQIATLNMSGLVNIKQLDCSDNHINSLNLSDMTNLEQFSCNNNNLTTLNLSGLTQMKSLFLDNNQIATIDISNMPNLIDLSCENNQLTSLDLSNVFQLQTLHCGGNFNLSDLNLTHTPFIVDLSCMGDQLSSLFIAPLFNLNRLDCSFNQLTNLDFSNNSMLMDLNCSFNQLTSLDFSHTQTLLNLNCLQNQITSLDFTSTPYLYQIQCDHNQLTTLDLSNMINLNQLWCTDNPLLTEINLKNGSNESIVALSENPSLRYICADEGQLQSIQSELNTNGMSATVSNSYCSFTPGGSHNTVIGTTIFDANNNGCNLNDPLHPNIRVDFSDGISTGSAFTNLNGICTFYAQAGNYTIFPNIENASAFNISPANAVVNFPNDNNNVTNQSFCLAANGVHPDVEVVLSPISPARPGFEATYKLVFKNKGNQMLSGNITLAFEDSKMDLVSASPAVDIQSTNNLEWAYNSLLPFESRTIELVFSISPPPTVNNDDLVNFSADITPVNADENPSDNTFSLHQTVVGSFDPNDIKCLEGDTVSPTEIGNYLHYVVNFENTGNFQADNVIVRDVIDTDKYDLSTLQVLNTSHDSYTRISGNVVEFIFQNINLSAAHGNPPVGGHGDVLFKIKTKENLTPNDTVLQRAGIYFDYNAPIDTTDAETTFAELSNPIFEFDNSVRIYPNPAKSIISIDSEFNIEKVELYDVQGRILETHFESGNTSKMDISNKSNGIYFLKIKTEKGSKVEKIVKE